MLDYINLQLFNLVIYQNLNCNMHFIVFYSFLKRMLRVECELFI